MRYLYLLKSDSYQKYQVITRVNSPAANLRNAALPLKAKRKERSFYLVTLRFEQSCFSHIAICFVSLASLSLIVADGFQLIAAINYARRASDGRKPNDMRSINNSRRRFDTRRVIK
jgi:hypothetical protein